MSYKKKMAAQFQCIDCSGWFDLHQVKQLRCPACSHNHHIKVLTERRRAKRLAEKENQSS